MKNNPDDNSYTYDILNEALIKTLWRKISTNEDKVEQMRKVNQLLSMSANPSYFDKYGNNAFLVATTMGNVEAHKEFFSFGYDLNEKTNSILNSMLSANMVNWDCVQYLKEKQDFKIIDKSSMVGMDIVNAIHEESEIGLQNLLNSGINAELPMGMGLFECVRLSNKINKFKMLVNNGASIEPYEEALIATSDMHNSHDIMEYIISYMGVSPDINYPPSASSIVAEVKARDEKELLNKIIDFGEPKIYSMDKILKI